MAETTERAREILERRTAVAMVATADPEAQPEVALLIAPRLVGEDRVAGGEEADVAGQTFRNLRRNARATILVLDPIVDPRARDGVRMHVEFLGAEEDGKDLDDLNGWLESFAPGRRVVRRLLFKILRVEAYRPRNEQPVVAS